MGKFGFFHPIKYLHKKLAFWDQEHIVQGPTKEVKDILSELTELKNCFAVQI